MKEFRCTAHVRLRLRVNAAGEPSLEFLDQDGNVVRRLPDDGK